LSRVFARESDWESDWESDLEIEKTTPKLAEDCKYLAAVDPYY
jgi:hypothetical protein